MYQILRARWFCDPLNGAHIPRFVKQHCESAHQKKTKKTNQLLLNCAMREKNRVILSNSLKSALPSRIEHQGVFEQSAISRCAIIENDLTF